jgi:hypothetical protein
MRGSLAGVRRRVKQLAIGAKTLNSCPENHTRTKVSYVWADSGDANVPTSDRPEQRMNQRCSCGEEITDRHIIHRVRWLDDRAPT